MKKDNIIHVKSADSGQNTIARVIVGNKISHNPTVSVIMPVYNVAPYLRQCMDSVVNQTLRDIEIICVDDNSTDDSLEILREYAAHDNRITILHQENLRAGAARNAGLAVARGEYLSFLDSDDFFESDMLESMVSKMTKTNADMVMCNCFLYNDSEQRDECVPWTLRSDLAPDVFSYTDLPNDIFSLSNCWVWNRMYRRSFIMENDIRFQNLGVANDTYFSCIATATAKRIAILDRRLIHYRTKQAGKQNVTSVKFRQTFPTDLLKCFADIYNKLCEMGVYNTLKNSYMRVMTEHVYWSRNAFVNDASLYSQFTKYLSDNYAQIFDTVLPFDSDTLNQKYIVLRNILVDGGVFHEIPRRVFYVWGANEPKRPEVQRCINSWLKYLPYYEIVEINENSTNYFNFQTELKSNRWFRTVYNRKMWAYVADYIRIKALYDNGGIYFDTDVSVLKNMDKFLNNQAFVGIQMSSIDGTGDWVEPAICGARRGNKLFGQIVDFYNEKIWTEPIYTMPQIFNYFLRRYDIFPFPEKQNQEIIHLPEITLYPERYFIPYRFRSKYTDDCIEPDTHTVHWWGGSWVKPAVLHFLQNKSKIWDNHNGARVSVIIPVYNVEKYLAQCLDSVINQTLRDIEIICVNDGSTDGSLEILKQYAARDNRIKIINQSNQGLSCSRNNALKIATGEYIDFLDSDDWLDANSLEILYTQAKLYDLDMLSFSGTNFNDGSDVMIPNVYWNFTYLPQGFNKDVFSVKDCWDFLPKMAVSSCLTMYSADFISRNKLTFPDGLCYEDNVFFTKAIINAQRCGIIENKLYRRRIHGASITQNWMRNFSDWLEIVAMVLKYLKSVGIPRKVVDEMAMARCSDIKNKYNRLPVTERLQYSRRVHALFKKYKLYSLINDTSFSYKLSSYVFFVWYLCALPVLRLRRKKKNRNDTILMLSKRCDELQTQISRLRSDVNAKMDKVANMGENISKSLGDDIQALQSELIRCGSEQYWAHVYHDTTINSSWLTNKSVSPGRWAVSYIVLYVLYRVLDEMRPGNILECGLGQSSKLTIQYARAHNAQLTIIENRSDWLKFFAKQMPDAQQYTHILDTEMARIVPQYESRTYRGFKQFIGKTKYNLVLIDGPRGSEHYSRPEILDIVDNLDDSFVIMLDDMNRIGEQETWQMLINKLNERGLGFIEARYTSDKTVGVLCSMDLAFFATL